MDRAEYRELMSQIKQLDAQGSYDDAADLIEEINWKRVKSASTLCSVAAILGRAERFDEEKELLLMAYDRASIGRSIIYELTENALHVGDLDEAKKYYNEYIETAPKDSKRYVLQYKIGKAQGLSAAELIPCLEELNDREFSEEWGYELARLYDESGEQEKCVRICDEIAIYFGEGAYVDKALELKTKYKELSAQQRKQRNAYHIGAEYAAGVADEGARSAGGKYDTLDLQKELANSLQQIRAAEDDAAVAQTMRSVRKMVDNSSLPIEAPAQEALYAESEAVYQNGMLQEEDGQMGLNLQQTGDDQVGGQIQIEDILAEWERNRQAAQAAFEGAEKKRLAATKEAAEEQTRSIMEQIEGLGQGSIPEGTFMQPAAETPEASADVAEPQISAAPAPEAAEPQPKAPVKPESAVPSGPIEKLTDEQKELFTYFMSIQGMERQICRALETLRKEAGSLSSASGNVLIIGDRGCGKTMMASKLVKAVQKIYPHTNPKVGKINAASLNQKDAGALVKKVRGGYLILEDAGKLNVGKAQELSDALDGDTGGLLVIMEGTSGEIQSLLQNGSDLGSKFNIQINIPVMSNDELVEFARVYAAEENASLDEMAVLALYTKISAIAKANHTTSLDEVKEIMDNAISKAARKNLSNTMRSIFSSRYDAENHMILVEKDFD